MAFATATELWEDAATDPAAVIAVKTAGALTVRPVLSLIGLFCSSTAFAQEKRVALSLPPSNITRTPRPS